MPTLEAAIEVRRREAPRRIAEEARTTLDNLPVLRAADGKAKAAQEARRMAKKCLGQIADLCLDDPALPPPPDLPANAGAGQKLNAVVAWGARAAHASRKRGKSRPPPDLFMRIWKIAVGEPGRPQQKLAELASSELGQRITQQKVSAALKRVEQWQRDNNRPDLAVLTSRPKRPKTVSVDPAELDATRNTDGERQTDGRTRRPPKEN